MPLFDYLDVFIPGLILLAGFFAGSFALRADLRRRRIDANAFLIAFLTCVVGFAAAYLTREAGWMWFSGALGGTLAVVVVARFTALSSFELLDACASAVAVGCAAIKIGSFYYAATGGISGTAVQLTPIYEPFLWLAIAIFLWRTSTRATLGPKPKGEIFSLCLLLTSVVQFLGVALEDHPSSLLPISHSQYASVLLFLAGGFLLWFVLARFHKISKERRILEHTAARGNTLQPEYRKPTPECPKPERWHMYDSMTAEVEVLDFLRTLVTTIKPELVVETGTFLGISTLRIAEGLRENGFGRVITCELDPKVYEEAKMRFAASGLGEWIDLRNESSLEMKVEGRIDLLYCDSDLPVREQEVRRFLPQMNPHGLILMHDASSDLKIVRHAALKLESEGLISVVLLPTPRGLVLAQKREGHK